MARFLSQEWVDQHQQLCEELLPERPGLSVRLQVIVIEVPGGGVLRSFAVFMHGRVVEMGVGEVERPDCSVIVPYSIYAALHRGEFDHLARHLIEGEVSASGSLQHLNRLGMIAESHDYAEVRRRQLDSIEFE